jgi:hypothetical protein
MAINESSCASGFNSDMEYYQLMKEQEEADAELARQLAEQDNPPPAHNADNEDFNTILEEIADAEAKEILTRDGNAYSKQININNIMKKENEEEERIKKELENELRLKQWREERNKQDAEYLESERQDKLKAMVRLPAPAIAPPAIPAIPAIPVLAAANLAFMQQDEPDEPEMLETETPKSKDELRKARLAFYLNKKSSME